MVIAENITPARITRLQIKPDGSFILWHCYPGQPPRDVGHPLINEPLQQLFAQEGLKLVKDTSAAATFEGVQPRTN